MGPPESERSPHLYSLLSPGENEQNELWLDIVWSTGSDIIRKWSRLGTIGTQPQSKTLCKNHNDC